MSPEVLSDTVGPRLTASPEGAGEPNYTLTPKTGAAGQMEGDLLEVAMGPKHPSTHGVFRMDVAAICIATTRR